MSYCRHCPSVTEGHTYTCDCGHTHDMHVAFGPCQARIPEEKDTKCSCLRYSQTQQKKVTERVKFPV